MILNSKTAAGIAGLLLLICGCGRSSDTVQYGAAPSSGQTVYDSAAAAVYGADEYGMKRYVMAFLKRGPNRSFDAVKAAELQNAHLANITRMATEGKLVLAGPFLDDGDLRGIYIFNVPTLEEARALTETDPAIRAGSLVMELKEWYGSAALVPLNDIHATLSRKGITE
ncbi:hypothetical protein JXO52_15450 [bacterium]|nr:hypothetical protein [bacterium]